MKKYKNYIVLIFVFAVSIIGCAYALKWHAVYIENQLNKTIITDYIHELKKEEFLNYVSENPNTVIYFGVTSDYNCRRFEDELKDYIVKNNLQETIVYMNVNELVGNDFGTKMDNLFNNKDLREKGKYLKSVPAVAVYNHTKLVDFASNNSLSISKVDKLLSKYNLNGE